MIGFAAASERGLFAVNANFLRPFRRRSLSRMIAEQGRGAALQRVCVRSELLFVVALLYSGGFSNGWPDIRLLGVLNRIALCYFFASVVFCFFKWRGIAGVVAEQGGARESGGGEVH